MWNSFFEDFGLTQYVSEKTHRSGGILDQVIASNNILINVKSNSFITSSDHSFICFSLSSYKQHKSQQRLMYRNWKNIDSDCFIKLLKSCLKLDIASSIDEAWDMYLRFEENILDSVLPLEIKTFTKHQCPFFDDELLRLKRKKRKAERKYRKSKTSVLKSEYEKVTHMYFEKFLEKRRLYIENTLLENCSRKKFATLKLLLGQDVEQLPKYDKKQLANDFNEFLISKVESIIASIPTAIGPAILKTEVNSMYSFTELSISQFRDLISASSNSTFPLDIIPTHLMKSFPDYYFLDLLKLLNLSLKAGYFPQSFIMAIVKHHLKKANSNNEDFSNYRPISNLSYISKLLERAAFMQMREHLEKNSLLSKCQSANRKVFSTETALIKVTNDLLLNLDSTKNTFYIRLDLSAAIDTLDHELLLSILETSLEIRDQVLSFLNSYLSSRSQKVLIDGKYSMPRTIKTGVPQGSILGLLLFSSYLVPLEVLFERLDVK